VSTIKATSPDGRTWEIGSTHEKMSMNKDEALFWPSVVLTVIMVAAVIVIAFYSTAFAIIAGIMLVIWLAERISNLMRPRFYARTEGPPAREVLWKGKRFTRGELEQKIVKTIESGNPDAEPPGLTLVHL
jgi:hypothetical protein